MHKMKVIFLVGYMLLTVFSSFALATGSSRWRMEALNGCPPNKSHTVTILK